MQDLLLNTNKSKELFEKSLELLPGGVSSPVRSFKSVESTPLFISKAKGAHIWDVDQNQYIDYVNSWGALIHGHAEKEITEAIHTAASKGTSYGAPHEGEIELAQLINSNVPSIERIRFVNSGTEAVMTAIRLARAYTKRNKIIKFGGCYHGHSDSVLSNSGSGLVTLGIPGCPGVTKTTASETVTLPFNDIHSIEITLSKSPKEYAAIIVEPIIGNCGVIPPATGFLSSLRELARKYKCVLIFDEVITGFRVSKKCAQGLFNIKPDLTTFGKIIGGGLPLAAVGGKKEIMDLLAPSGPVYQAGTFSGNPVCIHSGIAALKLLKDQTYEYLEELTSQLCNEIKKHNEEKGINVQVNRVGSMFTIFFTSNNVTDEASAKKSNTKKFAQFFQEMLSRGIYLAPSQFEANFVSAAFKEQDIKKTIEAYKESIEKI